MLTGHTHTQSKAQRGLGRGRGCGAGVLGRAAQETQNSQPGSCQVQTAFRGLKVQEQTEPLLSASRFPEKPGRMAEKPINGFGK